MIVSRSGDDGELALEPAPRQAAQGGLSRRSTQAAASRDSPAARVAAAYQYGAYILAKYIVGLDFELRGAEHRPPNNTAYIVTPEGDGVSATVDVVNSTLSVKVGWASEGNNAAKFTEKGEVDEPALRKLVRRQVAGGVAGVDPCGTTGESATLSHEEHREVIRLTIELARGRDIGRFTGAMCIAQGVLTGWLPGYLLLSGRLY